MISHYSIITLSVLFRDSIISPYIVLYSYVSHSVLVVCSYCSTEYSGFVTFCVIFALVFVHLYSLYFYSRDLFLCSFDLRTSLIPSPFDFDLLLRCSLTHFVIVWLPIKLYKLLAHSTTPPRVQHYHTTLRIQY